MKNIQQQVKDFEPILATSFVLLAINFLFNIELSLFSQPIYGYDFSGRLISVIQVALSTAFNYKPVPPTALLHNIPLYYLAELDFRIPVMFLWFSTSFILAALSNDPKGTLKSSSLTLLFITFVFLWGLSTRHTYTWLLLTLMQANPIITYTTGYLFAVLALGLGAYTSKILTSKRRNTVELLDGGTVKTICPNCKAEFRSNPVYCSVCGFHINSTEEQQRANSLAD